MRLSSSFSTRLARVIAIVVCFAWPVFGLLPNETTAVDLSPMLQSIIEDYELVAAAAFGASSTGVCAIGSAGTLSATNTSSVHLWDSPWHAGSLTKSMTASLAALLVKDDAVNLTYETTVGEVFETSSVAQDSPYSKVMLEQLLCHRGGFQTDIIASPEDVDKLLDLAKDEESMPLLEQRGTLVQYALTLDPATTPGDGFLYSNVGYLVAGHMMEHVSGMAWEDLMVDRLFAPLGMQSAYFGCPDTPHAPLGHDYEYSLWGGDLIPMAPDPYCDCLAVLVSGCTCLSPHLRKATLPFPAAYGGPEGAVFMRIADFVRYYQWHLAGELGKDKSGLLSIDEFHRLHSGIGEKVPDEDGVLHVNGHGWQIYEEEYDLDNPYGISGPLFWHDGSNLLWLAQVWMAPDVDRVYFTVTNSYRTASGIVAYDALDAMVESMVNSTLNVEDSGECSSIESLEQGSDSGSHAACPAELVYPKAIVPPDPESSALPWTSSCFILCALTVTVMVF